MRAPSAVTLRRFAGTATLLLASFVTLVALEGPERIATLCLAATCAVVLAAAVTRVQGRPRPTELRNVADAADPLARVVGGARFERCLEGELRRGAECAVLVVEPRGTPEEAGRAARTLAWAIAGAAGSTATVARLGEHTFAVLLPDASAASAQYVATRLHRTLTALAESGDGPYVALEPVVGVVARDGRAWTAPAMLEAARRDVQRSRAGAAPSGVRLIRLGTDVASARANREGTYAHRWLKSG